MSEKKPRKLTDKEKVFVNEYLVSFNGAQAAIKAGYSKKSIYSIAHENLRKPEIRAEIDRRMSELHMSADEVLARISDQARGSHRPFVKVNLSGGIYFDFSNPEALDHLHLIKKLETKRARRVKGRGDDAEEWEDEWVKVELHDPQKALELLGKYHKLFVEKVDLTSNGETPNLSAEQAAEKIAYLLEVAKKRKENAADS